MSFASPYLLWSVLLIPLAAAGYVLMEHRRLHSARTFASPAMAPNVAPVVPRWRRHVPAAFLLTGMLALAIAVARPQAALSVPRDRATVVLTLDT